MASVSRMLISDVSIWLEGLPENICDEARFWQKSSQIRLDACLLELDSADKTGGEVALPEGYQKPPMPRDVEASV